MTDFYDASDVPENAIEWLKGRKTATVTLAGGTSLNTRVRKLAKSKPDKCQITDVNEGGTIVAHIPVSWIKINPGPEYTEAQRAEMVARGRAAYEKNRTALRKKASDSGSKVNS